MRSLRLEEWVDRAGGSLPWVAGSGCIRACFLRKVQVGSLDKETVHSWDWVSVVEIDTIRWGGSRDSQGLSGNAAVAEAAGEAWVDAETGGRSTAA